MDVPVQAEKVNSSYLHHFVIFGPAADWMVPIPLVRAIFLLCLLIHMLISSGNNLIDTPRNNHFTNYLSIPQPSQVDT